MALLTARIQTSGLQGSDMLPSRGAGLAPLTIITVVVYQDDLLEELGGREVDHAVDGAQDDREGFIDKDEHHGDLGQVVRVGHLSAPAGEAGLGAVVSVGCDGEVGAWCPRRVPTGTSSKSCYQRKSNSNATDGKGPSAVRETAR